jgi:hypothetical protein
MCLKQKNLACASSESFIIVDRERAQYKLSITNRIGRRRRLSTTFATFRSCESQVETEKNFHSRFVTLFLLYFICRELCCKSISVKKIARSSKVKLGANWLTWCVQRQPIIIKNYWTNLQQEKKESWSTYRNNSKSLGFDQMWVRDLYGRGCWELETAQIQNPDW